MKTEILEADCQEENGRTKELFELSQSSNVEELKQEILTLTSSLADERKKNLRNENLLEMRSEYIKALLETDEINKARALIYLKDAEKLRAKVLKLKTYNSAKDEEMKNMFNTLKSQEFEIESAKHELQRKDLKLAKYKKQLDSGGSSHLEYSL